MTKLNCMAWFCMNDRDKLILGKVIMYIGEVLSYVEDLDFTSFSTDRKTINATAFVLGQIGELASQVSEETRNANPQIMWRGMRGLRNRIVHDYENIEMKRLWEVVFDELPELKKQIKLLVE